MSDRRPTRGIGTALRCAPCAPSPAEARPRGARSTAGRSLQRRDAHAEAHTALASTIDLVCWRHPRCADAAGRCIGRTDLPLDRRRAKRLAHRIRAAGRRHAWPAQVWTSPLQRCAAVGRWLRRWGWRHRIDARLAELDFGAWDGRRWNDIAPAEIAAWSDALVDHAPGGGESLRALVDRVRGFIADAQREARHPLLLVAHAGWMQALGCLLDGEWPDAARWRAPPRHGERRHHALIAPLATGAPNA